MFDIYCPHCGNPTEQDYLHTPEDLGGPYGMTYEQAAAAYKKYGCGLFNAVPEVCMYEPIESPQRMALIRGMMDFSDHPDEWVMMF